MLGVRIPPAAQMARYPNWQRTPAQTRCVVSSNLTLATEMTTTYCS